MGYLAKYLTKSIAECHTADDRPAARARDPAPGRPALGTVLAAVRQLAPLRRPAQGRPRRAPTRVVPGQGAPAEHLGFAGRRVLVSRKWSGKTLGDHRADRRDWVLNLLGNTIEPADPNRYAWEPVRIERP